MFLNLICLFYLTNIYASDKSLENNQLEKILYNDKLINDQLKLNDNLENQSEIEIENFPSVELKKYLPTHNLDREIFYSLDRILHKNNFYLKNGRWWLLKALLYAPTPFFCGANTLIIAETSPITVKLILAAQFTVPRTIESICNLTDQLRLAIFEKRLKIWWKEKITKNYKYGIPKVIWTAVRLASGIYLGYRYALIDAETAGDAYREIYSDVTNNEKALDIHDNVGYAFNFSYTAMLGGIFFIQLIDEFVIKGSFIVRTIYNTCKGRQAKNQDLKYEMLIDTITDLRSRSELVCNYDDAYEQIDNTIEEYLSDRDLNSINTIASLQKYLGPYNKPSSIKTNITRNLFKLVFIAGATIICGISFKYIFASATILRNYVNSVGDKQNNGSYVFKLKNGGSFLCDSIDDCTNGVDFNKIYISDTQKDKLLELNESADLANILQGVGISSDTAVLILSIFSLSHSMKNSYLHRRAFKIALFKGNRLLKILPFIGAAFIIPSMVFYLENVNNVRPVAKTANRLLKSTGQDSFIPVDVGIVVTLGVLGATFSLGARLLASVPSAIYSIPQKVINLPMSTKKLCLNISCLRCCR